MQPGITALILICSATLAKPDCTVDTATDMLTGFDANTPIECLMNSQALVAQSGLEHQLEKDQYLKVVCVPKETVAGILQRLDDNPPPFVHSTNALRHPVAPAP